MNKISTAIIISSIIMFSSLIHAKPSQAGVRCTESCGRFAAEVFRATYNVDRNDDGSVNGSNGTGWLWLLGGFGLFACFGSKG